MAGRPLRRDGARRDAARHRRLRDLPPPARATSVRTPILMLTARDAVEDRIAGLDTGADDYLDQAVRLRRAAREGACAGAPGPASAARAARWATRARPGRARGAARRDRDRAVDQGVPAARGVHAHPGEVLSRYQLLEGAWDTEYEHRSNVDRRLRALPAREVDRPFGVRDDRDRARRGLPAEARLSSAHRSACSAPQRRARDHGQRAAQELRRVEAVARHRPRRRPGEIVALLGPNGAGKTTIVEILEGYRTARRRRGRGARLDPGARRARCASGSASCCRRPASTPMLTVRDDRIYGAAYSQPAVPSTRCSTWSASAEQRDARVSAAVRRPAAAPGPGAGHRRRSRAALPRRAHHGLRPGGPAPLVGPDPPPARRRARRSC